MNKLVVTLAAGVYIVAPAPHGGDVDTHAIPRSVPAYVAAGQPAESVWVGINGGQAIPPPAKPSPRRLAECEKTRTWSIKRMLSSALNDDCEVNPSPGEVSRSVVVGSPQT